MFKAAFALGALAHSYSGSFAGSFLEASWRHSSSGFSLSQFVLFLHFIPDSLDDVILYIYIYIYTHTAVLISLHTTNEFIKTTLFKRLHTLES